MAEPPLPKRITDIEESLNHAHKEIEKLKSHLDKCYNLEADFERRLALLEEENAATRAYASDLEEYILSLDSSTRKRNLVISGLGENKNESSDSLLLLVYNFIQPYVETLELDDIDIVYRLGRPTGKSRPILCKFVREKTRNDVAAIRPNLNDEDSERRIYLNDDLPQLINERKSDFRMILKLAKSQNVPASATNTKITVNNITYSHKNLDCLPDGLKLEDAKVVKVKNGLAFQSHHAWLSNFYPANIVIHGEKFDSAEQAFQYTKAIRMKDTVAASLILKKKKPQDIKKLGAGVEITPQWDSDKIDVMRFIVKEKFRQNPDICQKLFRTGQQQLIEATLDPFWGAKATLTSKSLKTGTWIGGNMLGKIIMEIREELKREMDCHNLSNATAPAASAAPHVDTQQHSQPPPSNPVVASQRTQSHVETEVNKESTQEIAHKQNRRKGKKNKNRPSSSSSVEEGNLEKEGKNKKQRVFSPTTSLPPPRLLYSDLFNTATEREESMDLGHSQGNQGKSS